MYYLRLKKMAILGVSALSLLIAPVTASAATVANQDSSTPTTTEVTNNNSQAANSTSNVGAVANGGESQQPTQAEIDAQKKQAIEDQKNQEATNKNTQLQPTYTQSAIALNWTQVFYYLTASVSNIVGQGTAIIDTGTNMVGTLIGALKP